MSSSSKTVSQKEYLQKYLGKSKKKKTKTVSSKKRTVKVVDDNIDTVRLKEDYEIESGDDAPVIAGIIDERPRKIREMEYYKETNRWKPVDEANDKRRSSSRSRKNGTDSSKRRNNSRYRSSSSQRDEDQSPPRKRVRADRRAASSEDISPPRRDRASGRDLSPPRRRKPLLQDDLSPPRIRSLMDADISPPRRSRYDRPQPALSPVRRGRYDRLRADPSPSRRRRSRSTDFNLSSRSRHDFARESPFRRRDRNGRDSGSYKRGRYEKEIPSLMDIPVKPPPRSTRFINTQSASSSPMRQIRWRRNSRESPRRFEDRLNISPRKSRYSQRDSSPLWRVDRGMDRKSRTNGKDRDSPSRRIHRDRMPPSPPRREPDRHRRDHSSPRRGHRSPDYSPPRRNYESPSRRDRRDPSSPRRGRRSSEPTATNFLPPRKHLDRNKHNEKRSKRSIENSRYRR